MRILREDKLAAANADIRREFPSGVATVVKGFRDSVYYNLTPWWMIEVNRVGQVVNRPPRNSGSWRGPIGRRMTPARLREEGWITRRQYHGIDINS